MSVFVIAEAGVNHNGDLDTALKLVEVAAESGADAIKFQTFKASKTVKEGTQAVAYQKEGAKQSNQYDLLKALELSQDDHVHLIQRSKELGIEFMSTAFDSESARFLYDLGIKRIKVPSGEMTNIPFLNDLAAYDLEIILSTGMANFEEIEEAVDAIRTTRLENKFFAPLNEIITVLHCTSAYPTPVDQLNLSAISTIANHFGLPVGYSDHSKGTEVAQLAVALGASVYEKHFTLDRSMEGPDHSASLEPKELLDLIKKIRFTELVLGDGIKVAQPCESEARTLVRRSLFAARDIQPGHVITADDVSILRPGDGMAPRYLHRLIGSVLNRSLPKGAKFNVSDLSVKAQ